MKNLRSASVTQGVEKAPMRSLFYAMGYTKEELDRPLIGVVSAHSEIVPGHFHLDKVAEAVKAGIRMSGGTPIEVPAIGVCDGIAMGHIGMNIALPAVNSLRTVWKPWQWHIALMVWYWYPTAIRLFPVWLWQQQESICLPLFALVVL